jgi:5'-methylthioadenosine phosphorylase
MTTPWGEPSSPIIIAALPQSETSGSPLIAFLSRHGPSHTFLPSKVPSRANIAALKHLGVRVVLAFSAVGSLREEISPGSFVLPSQIIDRTKGGRPATFFDGSIVAHAAFGDPFSTSLCTWLEGPITKALNQEGRGVRLFTDKCIVCMEGPQFSTRAESNMYRIWGGDLINMSVLPEAKLAKEAEIRCLLLWSHSVCVLVAHVRGISYALIATATDYDSWRPHSASVTAHDVLSTLGANAATCRHIAATVLQELHEVVTKGLLDERGLMKYSIMPRSQGWKREDQDKLVFILPEYFALDS